MIHITISFEIMLKNNESEINKNTNVRNISFNTKSIEM